MFYFVLVFFVILSILVLVHELGHFLVARRAGIWVEEFGFGLPPRVFGKKIGETIYSVNLLPFGGFVRLHGENSEDLIKKPEKAFINKSPLIKAGIVVAGVIMNFLLGIFAFAIVYSVTGIPREAGFVKIEEIKSGSPAEAAGILPGDIVRQVDEIKIGSNSDFIANVDAKRGSEVNLLIERSGDEELSIKVSPRKDPPEGEGALGVLISDSEIYYPPIWQRPFVGVYYGFKEAIFWGGAVILGMFNIFLNLFGGVFPKDVAGPVGLFVVTREIAKVGIIPLINWVGIISVNLAILNILPIPALDGGRLLFIGIEKLFGRRILPKLESWLHVVGLGLLVLFLIAVTFREVALIRNLGIEGYLDFLSQQAPQ